MGFISDPNKKEEDERKKEQTVKFTQRGVAWESKPALETEGQDSRSNLLDRTRGGRGKNRRGGENRQKHVKKRLRQNNMREG